MFKAVFEKSPYGIVVLDSEMTIMAQNRKAALFLKRFPLPPEISSVTARIFDGLRHSEEGAEKLLSGEICFSRMFDNNSAKYIFKLDFCPQPQPVVIVYILEDSAANRVDMNRIRQQFRLTRRETDVVRCLLNGMKNSHIAETLAISEYTVKDHLSNIYQKLGVSDRFELLNLILTPQRFG